MQQKQMYTHMCATSYCRCCCYAADALHDIAKLLLLLLLLVVVLLLAIVHLTSKVFFMQTEVLAISVRFFQAIILCVR